MTPNLSRQGERVLLEVSGNDSFRSAQQIHAAMKESGARIGLATVYRSLQQLGELEMVDVLLTDDGTSTYRRCVRSDHHHHLICRNCQSAIEIDGPSVEAWAQSVAASAGFTDIEHVIELRGICADCRHSAV